MSSDPCKPIRQRGVGRGRAVCTLVICLFGMLCQSNGAVANTAPGIQASLGFSETVRLGRWAPLMVSIESQRSLSGARLEVEIPSGNELAGSAFSTTWVRDLQLTPGARRHFSFTVFIDNIAAPIEIRVLAAGKLLARHQIDIKTRFTDAALLLVMSRNANLDYLNERSSGRLRVAYPHPGKMPRQWQGYDGVTALILHGVTLESWNVRQYEALRQWLSQGGHLLVSGGPDYASLRRPRLAELLPRLPLGLHRLENGASLRAHLGDSFVAPRPFQIHRTAGSGGRLTLGSAQLPLLLEQQYGLGRVSYLTFDIGAYPFAGWSGSAQFWRSRLDSGALASARALPALHSSVIPRLFEDSGRGFARRSVVIGFLLAYLALLLLVYLSPPARPRVATLSHWLLPLLFALAAYLLFVSLLSPARVHARVVTVLESQSGNPYARLTVDLGVYSSRAGAGAETDTLQLARSGISLLPAIDPALPDQVPSWIRHASEPERLRVADSEPYVLHTLRGSAVVEFDFSAAATQNEAGFAVRLENLSPRAAHFCWLLYDGWLYPLGPLAAASVQTVSVDSAMRESAGNRAVLLSHLQGAVARDAPAQVTAMLHTLARYRRENPLQPGEALLLAVLDDSDRLVLPQPGTQLGSIDLLLSRLALQLLPAGGQLPALNKSDVR